MDPVKFGKPLSAVKRIRCRQVAGDDVCEPWPRPGIAPEEDRPSLVRPHDADVPGMALAAAAGAARDPILIFAGNVLSLNRSPTAGMKPAGLSEGPVVPRAEKAIETGAPKETIDFILKTVEDDLTHRFHHVMEKE